MFHWQSWLRPFHVERGMVYPGHQVCWAATCAVQHVLLEHLYQQLQQYLKKHEWQLQVDCSVQVLE
jgi:hypothetical protein